MYRGMTGDVDFGEILAVWQEVLPECGFDVPARVDGFRNEETADWHCAVVVQGFLCRVADVLNG